MNAYDLHGRVALVTGGASGLGRAVADRLAASGAAVAVLDRHPADDHRSVVADVTNADALDAAIAQAESACGAFDLLVHAAGIGGPWGSAFALDPAVWRQVVDVNLTGSYLVCRRLLPGMAERGYGRAVLVSSVAGKEGHPLLAAYASAKAGVIALVKSLARELAGTGVLINAVTPAAFATPMALEQPPELLERMRSAVPLGRLGEPDEAAALISWLVSEDCSFSTGAVFDLSGGRSTA